MPLLGLHVIAAAHGRGRAQIWKIWAMSSDATSGAVIALAGVLIGSSFKAVLDVIRDELTGGRERAARMFDAEREAYATYFAALDDARDLLDNPDLAQADVGEARLECWRRMNRALAMIDILAPQNISDLATEAYDV